ncbi:SDR family NAD(P)-dependent oxidoreductase [Lentzea flaviverrucosa]|uniref:NADP-dependent 3-hydroxy acid dehydrogenase YdfG n=1 Tax=Lentzea flaviverrucosa TaxID=200379 RepID=A0A1H9B4N2_9PSEU|nr:SDR family oxidoreductase [Lentzea flaviverrucosa]RDI31882.1 NADP-dependent 3-hydroxy acid dehydrogenase YdfG [Lentzea flaviverrucosa]SEP83976.1 NADP-dependent 3-hydroxy acid dehydrogenase YdfG [Lentzea flaviverrucosa]
MSTVDLTGRVALVTGGAGGIGSAVARRLAKLGAQVAVLDLDAAGAHRVASAVGGIAIAGDVSDPETMPAAVAQVERELGRLDVVHLNAGIGGGQAGVDDALDVARYRKLVGVNVDHVVYGLCAAVPALRRQGGGKVVITASLAGITAMPSDPLYTLTKHAVVGYARAAGKALAGDDITVSALCPGFVDTLLLGGAKEEFAAAGFPLLTPSDVAEAVQSVLAGGGPGEAWIIQPGGKATAYDFRGVPGVGGGQLPPPVVLGRV